MVSLMDPTEDGREPVKQFQLKSKKNRPDMLAIEDGIGPEKELLYSLRIDNCRTPIAEGR